jgi:hypothetical protein
MKENKWNVDGLRSNYARWRATFSSKAMVNKVGFWGFLEGLLMLGTKYEIIQFLEIEKEIDGRKYYFNVKSGESFIDFADRLLQQEGVLLFGEPRKCLSKLCFYDQKGEIVSKKVLNPGRILARTRDYGLHYPSTDAVTFFESLGFVTRRNYDFFIEDGVKYAPSNLLIYTQTNIWFPKVLSIEDHSKRWDQGYIYKEEWYDNSELALCHTPRFNKFIQGIKQLTIQYGGVWTAEYDDNDCDQNYRNQWDDNGIVLDN